MKALSRHFVGVQVFEGIGSALLYNDAIGSTRCHVVYWEKSPVKITELDPALADMIEESAVLRRLRAA